MLQHTDKSGHPICVKLGTVTKETIDSVPVHCYACDDEVLDKQLGTHMLRLGWDVGAMAKTEKNIAEMEVDANLYSELSKVVEEGAKLEGVTGPRRTGLVNLGNTCQMNSILQVLSSLKPFYDTWSDGDDQFLTSTSNPVEDFYVQMQKLFAAQKSGEYSIMKKDDQEYQIGIRPYMIRNVISRGHAEFSSSKQQDASEQFSYLLEFMAKQSFRTKRKDPSKLFVAELQEINTCTVCQKSKLRSQQESMVKLQIPDELNSDDASPDIRDTLEQTWGGKSYNLECLECGQTQPMIRKHRVSKWPNVLGMCALRFKLKEEQWNCPENPFVKVKYSMQGLSSFDSPLDLSKFTYEPLSEDQIMKEKKFEPNPHLVSNLLGFGVSQNFALNCCRECKNDENQIEAWLGENMGNPKWEI